MWAGFADSLHTHENREIYPNTIMIIFLFYFISFLSPNCTALTCIQSHLHISSNKLVKKESWDERERERDIYIYLYIYNGAPGGAWVMNTCV